MRIRKSTTDGMDSLTSWNLLGSSGSVIGTTRGTGTSEEYYLYTKDIRESTTNIIDDTGTGIVSYQYDDFGETETFGDREFFNEICYTGGIHDASTGIYYLNARYYDPASGVFLSQDSYRGELNDPASLNLYGYCQGNPITYTDPSGHIPLIALGLAVYRGYKVVKTTAKIVKTTYKVAKTVKKISKAKKAVSTVSKSKKALKVVKATKKVIKAYQKPKASKKIIKAGKKAKKIVRVNKEIKKLKKAHGNSKKSKKKQHVYEIYEKGKNDEIKVVKTGISGGKITKDGKRSYRATKQVNEWNRKAGYKKYEQRIVARNINGRKNALQLERRNANRLRGKKQPMNKHVYP